MKKLNKILLVLVTLCVTNVFAQTNGKYHSSKTINDYKIEVKTKTQLAQGLNNIDVKIRKKSRIINNADVTLSILHPNNSVIEYKRNMTNENKYYSFNINLPVIGEYSYVLTFSRNGGVQRKIRGNLSL